MPNRANTLQELLAGLEIILEKFKTLQNRVERLGKLGEQDKRELEKLSDEIVELGATETGIEIATANSQGSITRMFFIERVKNKMTEIRMVAQEIIAQHK